MVGFAPGERDRLFGRSQEFLRKSEFFRKDSFDAQIFAEALMWGSLGEINPYLKQLTPLDLKRIAFWQGVISRYAEIKTQRPNLPDQKVLSLYTDLDPFVKLMYARYLEIEKEAREFPQGDTAFLLPVAMRVRGVTERFWLPASTVLEKELALNEAIGLYHIVHGTPLVREDEELQENPDEALADELGNIVGETLLLSFEYLDRLSWPHRPKDTF